MGTVNNRLQRLSYEIFPCEVIQILYTLLLFLELFSIPIAMFVSFQTDNKYVEIGMLSYLLFLLFIIRYQLENFQPII